MSIRWSDELTAQLDEHWRGAMRPRWDGLRDDEYRWEPTATAWNVRPRGTGTAPVQAGTGDWTIDFAFPEPEQAPVTTIAWRLGHLIVGVLGIRNASHFGGPPMDYQTHSYAGTADGALAQLDEQYATWIAGVRSLDDEALTRPVGEAEGPYAARSTATLVLHINREMLHHGAEISLLRDLYRDSGTAASGSGTDAHPPVVRGEALR